MTHPGRRSTSSSTLGWQMRECPLSRHLGMEAPASPRRPPTLAGAFHSGPRWPFFHSSKVCIAAQGGPEWRTNVTTKEFLHDQDRDYLRQCVEDHCAGEIES